MSVAPGQPGAAAPDGAHAEPEPVPRARLGRSTAVLAVFTGASRVAGLAREIIAAAYFGVSAQMSAFTIAFQVPNLIRMLVADFALQSATVPVFTRLLGQGERRRAGQVASALLTFMLLVLGVVCLLAALAAPVLLRLLTPGFASDPGLRDLSVDLTRLMLPLVVFFALSGIVAGLLNSLDHFGSPAFASVVWNLVIIAVIVAGVGSFAPGRGVMAYGLGVVAATVVLFLIPLPWLRGSGVRLGFSLAWRDPEVGRVLMLMLPVTAALGLSNLSNLVNSAIGTLVAAGAPAAIDKAFRLWVLPHGLIALSVATVLYPTIARRAAAGDHDRLLAVLVEGARMVIYLMTACAILLVLLAEPVTQLVYQRGAFDPDATTQVAAALRWWAVSLPFDGVTLLLTRVILCLDRPWLAALLAGLNLAVNVIVALALHAPFGIAGVVLGFVVGSGVMFVAQLVVVRRALGSLGGLLDGGWLLRLGAVGACMALVLLLGETVVDAGQADGPIALAVKLAVLGATGTAAFALASFAARLGELRRLHGLVRRRARSRG